MIFMIYIWSFVQSLIFHISSEYIMLQVMNQKHQLCDEGFLCQWYIKMQPICHCGNLQLVMRSKSRYKPSTTHVHISTIHFAPPHYLPCFLWNSSFLFWLELVKCSLPRSVLTFLTAKHFEIGQPIFYCSWAFGCIFSKLRPLRVETYADIWCEQTIPTPSTCQILIPLPGSLLSGE